MTGATNSTETYRLKQWEEIIHDREASGLSIKSFCERAGYHPNKFYYWQRKLRERASVEHLKVAEEIAPTGWAVCNVTGPAVMDGGLSIQIGRYQVNISGTVDAHQLEAVCRVLARLC